MLPKHSRNRSEWLMPKARTEGIQPLLLGFYVCVWVWLALNNPICRGCGVCCAVRTHSVPHHTSQHQIAAGCVTQDKLHSASISPHIPGGLQFRFCRIKAALSPHPATPSPHPAPCLRSVNRLRNVLRGLPVHFPLADPPAV